ncbi:TPA: hypothetical protein ACIJTN_004846 [Klebsiella pneumoniae]|uniref:hypothetical protein n=1 Tax=Klebsiella TaxID=570 RepID=UPI001C0144C1|nr:MULTISPECIES: hypothetical protein [Klebsiella]HDT3127554.1 hypothetical protein [Klebsiella variicola]EKZ6650971.1 hypothetical protein [Klebsiella pneumoniae]MBT9335092.1 hypothetical protein [Klebsiella sp. O852]HBR2513258.1 hypothetical protein [Klebsiella pneumoniae]HBR3303727.1 hypothetical protein [Klebsiella pneumoniae]
MNQVEIENLCIRIRNYLDIWSEDKTLEAMIGSSTKNFPNGCCGLVTECLSLILYKLTGSHPNNVTGTCDNGDLYYNQLAANSHIWIEINGINIDLTGDQFNDGRIDIPPVFVSSSPHPLSTMMTIKTKPAILIGITKPASGFDREQLLLINKLRVELNLF